MMLNCSILLLAAIVPGLRPDMSPGATAAVIQRAIDAASGSGGGVVTVPAGIWTSGTIWLRSGIELNLADGAVLKASPNLDDYNALDAFEQNYSITNEQWTGRHFIIFHEIENAAITGHGVIDGNSEAFYEEKAPPRRPGIPVWRDGIRMAKDKTRLRAGPMIFCIECRNLRFEDFTAKDSPCWCLTLQGCDGVKVRGYKVRCGPTDGNSDGIDICTCTDVAVDDCDIVTGDDAIAITSSLAHLKHHTRAVCERIRVTNCRLHTSAMGIRFGVGEGLVRDVEISDVTVDHAGWAVSFETYYGVFKGHGVDMEGIVFNRLTAKDCYGNWRVRAGGDMIVNGVRRITFKGCAFGGLVYGNLIGDATMPIRDIRFDNCTYSVFEGNTFCNMLKDAPNR